MSPQSDYLTHKEVAAYLRTTPNALHVMYAQRKSYLPRQWRFGKKLLYKRSEVEACVVPADQGK